MTFFCLLCVFALEQWRPFPWRVLLRDTVGRLAGVLETHFNAGQTHHGLIAWCLALLPACVVVLVAERLLRHAHPAFALVFDVLVLYACLGFRQGSHYFTSIHRALKDGDLDSARRILAEWRGVEGPALSREEVARLSIENALVGAHHFVFAVVFWYVLLPGPTGAVLYRLSSLLVEAWDGRDDPAIEAFSGPARRIYRWLDAIPARLTAAAFAIVGDFEDAIFCWRTQAAAWAERFGDEVTGIILTSGAGAMGCGWACRCAARTASSMTGRRSGLARTPTRITWTAPWACCGAR
jgi:adenosylcobinamide-phosphate synthase